MKCENCGNEVDEDNVVYSDDKKPLCESCYYEAEPIATVVFSGGEKEEITEWHNPTDFKIGYHRSDGWRGYYEVVKSRGWAHVHEDCILSYSEDEAELKQFDEKLERFCSTMRIPFAKVFCRTSNLFSSGYDFYVKSCFKQHVKKFIAGLKARHRSEERFLSTALTGADPKDQTPQDKLFVKCVEVMQGGAQ